MLGQERPQDFELIELLIREVSSDVASTSTQQGSDFESFKARFQSYIDQVPSYLHSVGKEGFFPHFFLGSFSTLVDKEIATKLNIEKVYFSFDSAKTLKVAVIKKGEIKSPEDAADKVRLFVIAESGSTKKKFSYGELDKILGNTKVARNNVVRLARDQGKLSVRLVEITKEKDAKGKMAGISVNVGSNKLDNDASTTHEFKEIKKELWNNPESDIAKLTNPDVEKVKGPIENILKKVSKVHSEYGNSLVYADQAREAAHHGFVASTLVNFRYRHNLRVYLEQFAGRGYADIVLVPRGKDRSLNAVPIIIELKAGTGTRTTPGDALEQAKDYAKGFQPNTMRVLTVSDNVLCVGLNLDATEGEKFSMHISPREDREIAPPTMQALLKEASDWNGERSTITDITEKIKQPLERIYHTFPGTPEKGGNYFSRFLLGQLLLANEFKRINLERSVFLYNEYPLAAPTRPGAQSTERPVTTFMLTKGNQGQDKEVFIFHIREGGKGEFSEKKIPIDLSAVSKITEVCISLQEKKKSDFFNVEKVNRYNSLDEYKQGKSFFDGERKNIPYPAELKETFDKTLESQHTPQSSSTAPDSDEAFGNYKGLLEKIGEGILPFKSLIEKEAHFQAVLHGAFSHYSDIKLGESQENRALVLTEFQTGRGKRIDMVVHGIKFAGQGRNAKEYTPVGLELKGPREGKKADALVKETDKQILTEYKEGVTYKTLTDGDKVAFIGVTFDKEAKDKNSLILTGKAFQEVEVRHSSVFRVSQLQPKNKFNPNLCVQQSSRSKRSINNCLFLKGDVEKFSKGNIDENNVDKIIIDSEKFLTYVKNSQDEGKNAQLGEFIENKNIEGDYKYLVDKVIVDQGYERYIQNERIKDLYGDVLHQNSDLTKNPKLKSRLMNAAGGIQLIRGIHGAIVSCKDGTATDCGLNLGGIGWSFASQPIENVMVKITPRVVTSAEKVVGKIISGTLGKQTKFVIQVAGVKFGSTVAKGVAGAVGGVFDIIDIGISANNLVDCKNRESSDNPCGEKEIRDNIASISFSGVSFVSGVALTALGMPVVGIGVGLGLMVGYGVYSGVSNIIEYEEKYDTTGGENWSIFWRTILFQPMAADVQHLAARTDVINSLTKGVWQALNNDSSNVVAYGIGLGKLDGNTLHPDDAQILMNKAERANTVSLSRVIPRSIEGASRICLPQVTGQDYEKEGTTNSFDFDSYYCENSVVISHDNRLKAKQKGNTIIYDLQNIDKGEIVGSNEWNNNFLIYPGTTEITGGSNVANRFVLINNPRFLGKIIGGKNSTNILDLSQLKDEVIGVNINYRFKPNASGSLKARVNGRWLINDQIDSNDIFNYHYVGRKSKADEVLCMGYSERFAGTDDNEVIVDSGGGSSNSKKDVVEGCKRVIISPYTTVKGGKSNYTFYVKTADYRGRGLYSEIDVDGTGTVVFPEIDLLGDCDQVTYSKNSNTLSLKINFGQNNQFTLDVKNYVEQSSNKPRFALIDKNGSNIVPKIERSDSSTIKITSFELHSEHSLDNFDNVESHYKKILNNNKDYKVFSVIRDRVQNHGNSAVPNMVFGSQEDDVMNFDQGTIFARGGKGSDVYIIVDGIGNKEIQIDNYSDDEKADTLFMPEVEKDFLVQQCNLHLNYNNTSIQVKNYLQDRNYRHLVIMNKKGETFIPYVQSMSCSSSEKGKLVPFFHATQAQNMFVLPKDFQDDHVVIDSRLEDIERYRNKDHLLLIRNNEVPFIIKVENFYDNQSKWRNVNFFLWNDGNFSSYLGLQQEVNGIMDYQDKLKSDYEKTVKEYTIDFTESVDITHNQNGTLNSIEEDEKRIGVMILKNITPDRIRVSSSNTDLVFSDEVSNHTINIKNWNNSESHRISTLEFDLGLEPITLGRLDRFSLYEVGKVQDLIEKASENYQNRGKYTLKVENDFKCLTSVDGFERENKEPTYQCLGFSSLQDQVSFTENFCSLEQIQEFKSKMPNSNQILTLLEKLENNLLLNGYDSNIIDQCNKWMITSGFGVLKPLVSTAIYEGKWDEVKTLLDKTAKKSKADVEHKSQCSQKWTPLHYAIYNGNVKLSESLFKSFLEKKGDINALTSCNDDNWAFLHYAVHYGNLDMVSFLIDKGANIEIRSKEGKTPLYLAVEEAKQNIINLLLDRGADIEAKNNDGRTPLYLAAYNNDSGVIELLCNRIKTKSNDAFKMIKQVEFLKKEVVNQANIPSNAKRSVESCISSLRDSIKNAAKKVLKDGMLNDLNASTIKLVDGVYNFDKKLFGEAIKEAVNDVYWQVGVEKVLRFIRSHHYIDQFIPGYIAVFDKIPKNDGAMFKLAYYIKETMDMGNYVNSEKRSALEGLKSKLPEPVRNAVFSSVVCIKNVAYGRYLYSPNDDCMYHLNNCDSDRRYAFTWPSNRGGSNFKWKVELNGDNVYLKNVEYGRYLYSPNDDCTYHLNNCDSDRRYAFTWPSNRGGSNFKWKVELNGNSVYLKNVAYGRYLYSPNDDCMYHLNNCDSDRRYAFTWRSNGKGGQFKWKIENCGSTRSRRSIQESNDYNKTVVDDKSILTEEDDQQIASRISTIVEDVERRTLNQSQSKLDLENRGKSNADLYPDFMRREICSKLNTSERRNIVLGGNDVCTITSGHETLDIENFSIQEVVINEDVNGKKSLRSILDLHQLVQQVDRDLSIKPIPTIIKDKNDLLIKLSISATSLQQDVITVRLKDALVNKWYKKLQIIFDNAPMEIDDSLGLKSSFFISDEKIIVVTPQDVEEKNKLIISKKAGQYTYLHDKYDLIVTNAFNADIKASESCIIRFRDFYKEPKMKTLSIKFTDKEILLSNEIGKIYNSDIIDKLSFVNPTIDLQENSAPLKVTNSGDINARGELDRTSLHLASEAGEFDKVKLLLDRGANIEVQDKFGYTPIFLATQSGKWSMVELLLDRGANIDAQDEKGQTLLHFAASGNNLDMVQFLLNRGTNIEVQDKFAWTPIFSAAQSGKWGVVKLLISNGAKFNNETTVQGTPLHFAVQEGNLDMIRFLLDEGAEIESQDKDNKKPLHLAVEAGRLNVVKLLLNRGASVNAKDENNKTPLDLATKGDMIGLLKRAQLDQGLSINARDGTLNRVKGLIAQGANLEIKGNNDNTPLHNACSNGHLKVVECLIEKGASLKARNRDGKIPLDLATQKGYTDIVQMIKQVQSDLNEKLLSAVKNGDPNKVDDLVSHGASLEVKDSNGNTLLHYASQNDHLRVVEYLIEKGASLKAKNKDGEIPLDLAVKKNYINIRKFLEKTQLDLDKELLTAVQDGDLNKVKGLANRGASLDTKDNNDWTLLYFAASSDKFDIVKFLLDKNANIKAKDVHGNTPLHVAAQYGSKLEVVEFLLDKNASGINDVNNNGSTPLHVAIQGNKPSTVKLLLNRGASIEIKDSRNRTSLDLARQEGYTNIVEMIEQIQSDLDKELLTAVQDGNLSEVEGLISQNANVNTTDMYSWTPLHWAAFKGYLEVAEFLVKKGADVNAASENLYGSKPIHIAVENDNENIVEFLLSKGVDVNDTDKQGYTPLHYAAWRGRLEVAKFLIEKGANISAKDKDDRKPIHVAAENNSKSVIEFLISKGINVDKADKNGWTPLHYAAKFDQLEVAKFLVGKGADIDAADASTSGKKPIHVAAENNNRDIIELLLSEKVSINDTDEQGYTPLHWASWGGHLDLVKYLIGKGANINAECKGGKTPLDVAIDRKYDDVIQYLKNEQLLNAVQDGDLNKVKSLISRGASVNAKDKNGRTPLHYVSWSHYLDIVKYLISKDANIDAQDDNGSTPLNDASSNSVRMVLMQAHLDKELLITVKGNDLEKIKGLIAKDVSSDQNRHGAYYYAWSGNLDTVKFLVERDVDVNATDKYNCTLLHWAALKGHLDVAKVLIGKGANVNAEDVFGRKPIHVATINNHKDIIELFIGKRVNIDNTDENGRTPLYYAARFGQLESARFLLDKGANINAADNSGKKPVHVAAENNNKNIIEFLLSKGVSVDEADKNGWTPLHWAALEDRLEAAKFLVDKGANINAEDVYGKKPIHRAAIVGYRNIIEFLLSKGVSVDEIDNGWTRTPLHWASDGGYLDVVRCLISNGANINAKDKDGKTPLDIARDKGHSNIVEYLEKKLNEKGEKSVQRRRRHHHGDHARHHMSGKPLAIDSSNQPEVAASSGTRPSSWINDLFSWVKKLAASTLSIIPGLPAQYNIADKNDDINLKGDNNNVPRGISDVGWNDFLNNENIALASCVADALDDTPSRRYQNLISKGVEVVPSRKVAVEFALRKFDLFVEGKIRNLGSKEQARIRVELKDTYPEITASLERGVEFSGNIGLDDVLEKCKKCFCTDILSKDKVSTCLSDVGVIKFGNILSR